MKHENLKDALKELLAAIGIMLLIMLLFFMRRTGHNRRSGSPGIITL